MKTLIAALLLTLTFNAFAEEAEKDKISCERLGDIAESIGGARDRGVKLVVVMKIVGVSELTKAMALDIYKRSYFTPAELSDRWVIKCYDSVN